MRYYDKTDSFPYSWSQVVRAYWQRYPNPNSGHVLSEDVVSRRVEGDRLFTKRFITKTNRMPRFGEMIIGQRVGRQVGIVEESVVDAAAQTLVTYTRNIAMSNILSIEERCEYRPSSSDPRQTECIRHAWISSSITGVSRAVTAFGYERFRQNCHKASAGFIHVMQRLYPDVHVVPAGTGHLEGLKDTARKLARNRPNPHFVVAATGAGSSS